LPSGGKRLPGRGGGKDLRGKGVRTKIKLLNRRNSEVISKEYRTEGGGSFSPRPIPPHWGKKRSLRGGP